MTSSTPSSVIRLLPATMALIGLGLLLGLGLGPVVATDGPRDGGASRGDTAVDLTRHTNVIIEGDAGSRGHLSVSCPSGTVVGGGFSAGRNVRITESRPHGIRTWRISWLQTSDDDSVAYAYAVCLTSAS